MNKEIKRPVVASISHMYVWESISQSSRKVPKVPEGAHFLPKMLILGGEHLRAYASVERMQI